MAYPVQLIVIGNGQQDVSRSNQLLLVVPGSIPSQLQHLWGIN